MKKIKKPGPIIKTQKTDRYRKLIADDISKKTRTASWIQELIDNDGTKGSKRDAIEIMDYLKKEVAYLNQYQRNISTCQLNLRMAVHFFDQGGYELLGHASLKACLETELPKAKSIKTLYREAKAAQLEIILFGVDKIGTAKESILRPLSKFGSNEKLIKKAWKMAMEEKSESSEFPTAKLVKKAIHDLLNGEKEKEDNCWSKQSAADIAEKIAPRMAKMIGQYKGKINQNRIHKVLELIKERLLDEFDLEKVPE